MWSREFYVVGSKMTNINILSNGWDTQQANPRGNRLNISTTCSRSFKKSIKNTTMRNNSLPLQLMTNENLIILLSYNNICKQKLSPSPFTWTNWSRSFTSPWIRKSLSYQQSDADVDIGQENLKSVMMGHDLHIFYNADHKFVFISTRRRDEFGKD